MSLLGDIEKFFHEGARDFSTIIRASLIHVQFETIHPFLDGNGRLGAFLMILLLVADGVLSVPLLYLSLFFKQHRARYYELLQQVDLKGFGKTGLTSSSRRSR